MRFVHVLVAVCSLVLGASQSARAAMLPFTGSITLEFSTLTPVVIPGSGTAIVNGSSGPGHLTGLELGAGAFATALVVPITDPAAAPIQGVQLTAANGTGSFAGVGGAGFGGVMPLLGVTKVCLYAPCSAALANLTVPLSVVGAGGVATVTGLVDVTVIGAAWTTQTASIGTITVMGSAGPASSTGAPGGTVSLVTPVFIMTGITTAAYIPTFARLTLQFVPEPGTVVLLGAGVAGLVAFARRSRLTGR